MNTSSLKCSLGLMIVLALALISFDVDGAPRTGIVALDDHALKDDQGHFKGLGITYMSALYRAKHDRAQLRADLELFSRHGFNYIRVLSMVGWYPGWHGREIAPVTFQSRDRRTIEAWPDYWKQLEDLVDIAYDDFGLRTQLTIFADAQLMPDKSQRIAHMQKILGMLRGREHKVILLEVANEAWQNGFPGEAGIADLREYGRWLNDRTPILVALSAPSDYENPGILQIYQDIGVDIATIHFSRDVRTDEGGWRAVRDPWRLNTISRIPPAASNEPIGPGSSVAEERDPIKLVSAAAYAWMSGLPMYVYHTRAGVTGDERFEDQPAVRDFIHVLQHIPSDIGNWRRTDRLNELFAASAEMPDSGLVHHILCTREERFIILTIGIAPGGVEAVTKRDLSMTVLNPLTGEKVLETTRRAGERVRLPQGPGAYLIHGRTGEMATWESEKQ